MTALASPPSAGPLTPGEVEAIRRDFPILAERVRGAPLAYLDTAATAQRPRMVLEAMADFARHRNAAVHRGAHALAEAATDAFEAARAEVAAFLGAQAEELVVTSGTTGAINLAARAIEDQGLCGPGDRIVVTEAEHHSNLLPWQGLAARTGAELAWLPLGRESGRLDLSGIGRVINQRTKVVAFTHASNVTGAVTDVAAVLAPAQAVGALTLLDAAQTAPHLPFDFHALGVDLAAVSAHKMLGPGGVGALLGRAEVLAALPPPFTGGSMVELVTMTEATFLPPPQRFEAGTQPVAELVGWAAACRYLGHLGMERVAAREAQLLARLLDGVAGVAGARLLGPVDTAARLGAVALEVAGVHPHDVGQYLDSLGLAVRVGHHCAQPAHRALGTHASTRASLGVYTLESEVDRFVDGLSQVRGFFGVGA